MASWAKQSPTDAGATAAGVLAGTTTSETYGPPYNHASSGQSGARCAAAAMRPGRPPPQLRCARAATSADGSVGMRHCRPRSPGGRACPRHSRPPRRRRTSTRWARPWGRPRARAERQLRPGAGAVLSVPPVGAVRWAGRSSHTVRELLRRRPDASDVASRRRRRLENTAVADHLGADVALHVLLSDNADAQVGC